MNMKTLTDFTPEELQVSNPGRELHHIFSKGDIPALWAAHAAQRPLLVRGLPGTGKSQMAKAIAEHLGWAFVSHVIRGDTELSDLHWDFDAVARLGEAQAQARPNADKSVLDPQKYLSPGAFWWAYDWHTAARQYADCHTTARPKPYAPENWDSKKDGVVLLIDEIDKADPDLPNGLLETIGELTFTVPYLNHAACEKKDREDIPNPVKGDSSRLLIVVTTNEERELPQAFVRRCFVHSLKMEEGRKVVDTIKQGQSSKTDPVDVTKREQWLMQRGKLHYGTKITNIAYHKAASLLWKDRDNASHKRYPPGLAEYIDLLNVLSKVKLTKQAAFIDRISAYAYDKELRV